MPQNFPFFATPYQKPCNKLSFVVFLRVLLLWNILFYIYDKIQVIIFMWTYPSYPHFAFLDERAINTVGDSLVFHPRCGLSVSLFNGFRSAHRPRYVSFQILYDISRNRVLIKNCSNWRKVLCYKRIFWKRLHVRIKNSHRLPDVFRRILRSKWRILRSLMPNEHPEQNRLVLLMEKHGH